MSKLTHFNQAGEAHMVDIADKPSSARRAIASGRIVMQAETLELIQQGGHKKGDVLGVARVGETDLDACAIECIVTAETTGQTGVEMEALTGVQVTLLTIYDMCKAVDRGMVISDVRLLEKSGGKSGHWKRD